MTDDRNGWTPDPNRVGHHWRDTFAQPRGATPGRPASSPPPAYDDADLSEPAPSHDLTSYKPWLLQRGRARSSLMLSLRRFEARSGLWQSWGLPYPNLYAVETMGDRMMSLDFGARQFVVEGRGLDELARRIGEGSVLAVLEYAASVWPTLPDGPVVTAIRPVGRMDGGQQS